MHFVVLSQTNACSTSTAFTLPTAGFVSSVQHHATPTQQRTEAIGTTKNVLHGAKLLVLILNGAFIETRGGHRACHEDDGEFTTSPRRVQIPLPAAKNYVGDDADKQSLFYVTAKQRCLLIGWLRLSLTREPNHNHGSPSTTKFTVAPQPPPTTACCAMPRASFNTLPPLLLRFILSFLGIKEQLRTVGRLRCTYRGYARTLAAAPLDLQFACSLIAFPTTLHAQQQWARSATNVLTSLSVMCYSRQAPGVFFRCLQNLPTLRCLKLFSTGIEAAKETLPLLPALSHAMVTDCKYFTSESLGKQSSLQRLELSLCPNLCESALASLTALTSLILFNCAGFKGGNLAPLTSLRRLRVQRCSQFRAIAAIPLGNLTSLEISACAQVADDAISLQTNLQHLHIVTLAQINGTAWARLTNLSSLVMRNCPSITDRAVATLQCLPRLRDLSISCARLQYFAFPSVSNLTSLRMSACFYLKADCLANLCHLPDLRHLRLHACQHLCDRGLACVASLSRLTSLTFIGANRVTDDGIAHLSRLPRLRHLSIGGCSQLRGTTLVSLTNLTDLCIRRGGCFNITDKSMSKLRMVRFSSEGRHTK